MKHMKRILSFLIASLLLASFAGCLLSADPSAVRPDPASEIEAPVFTLAPDEASASDSPSAAISDTEAPAPTQASLPTPEPTDQPTAEPTAKPTDAPTPTAAPTDTPCPVSEDGAYWTKDEHALYIHLYGRLPKNYITKEKAKSLGWPGSGSLDPYASGCSIGGDYFGNYEGLLPKKKGRKYTECDIDTRGKKSRGAKRIVFSNDGLIYYTDDHYESFTLLYGEE